MSIATDLAMGYVIAETQRNESSDKPRHSKQGLEAYFKGARDALHAVGRTDEADQLNAVKSLKDAQLLVNRKLASQGRPQQAEKAPEPTKPAPEPDPAVMMTHSEPQIAKATPARTDLPPKPKAA